MNPSPVVRASNKTIIKSEAIRGTCNATRFLPSASQREIRSAKTECLEYYAPPSRTTNDQGVSEYFLFLSRSQWISWKLCWNLFEQPTPENRFLYEFVVIAATTMNLCAQLNSRCSQN
ncbi:hypothetical protein EVAR_76943_1 [Eumeta japonica]|uniref:Uncharacterized protein n=1 Tax=Eumeta variegata TaxID=151549 RepID=A0A4C1SF85_EUMVA|nr:hypothetical protein EVAR_76943_1 [Eumeta japonica]